MLGFVSLGSATLEISESQIVQMPFPFVVVPVSWETDSQADLSNVVERRNDTGTVSNHCPTRETFLT